MKTKSVLLLMIPMITGSFIAGILLGPVFGHATQFGKEYENMLRLVTAEHMIHAGLLREGKSGEVLGMIESTFPSSVAYYDMFKLRDESDIARLWRIREYGEKYHLSYPAPAASLLAALPPKP